MVRARRAVAASLVAVALVLVRVLGRGGKPLHPAHRVGPDRGRTTRSRTCARGRRARRPSVFRRHPHPAAPLPTVESTHPELRASLAALRAAPVRGRPPAGRSRVPAGLVLDLAIEHFDDALKMNARMAAAYDARARVWREWGLLGPAVGDAHRAVFFAPRWAGARNTLGTILTGLGDRASAAAAYRCAVQLEPAAVWARINLDRLHDPTPASAGDCFTGKPPRI